MSGELPRAPNLYALYRNPADGGHLGPYGDALLADDDWEAIDKARSWARVRIGQPGYAPEDAMSLTALEKGRRHVGAWSLRSLAA